jgi:mRNA interferase YafQ
MPDGDRRIRVVPVVGFAARYKAYAKNKPAIKQAMHTFNEIKRKIPPEKLPAGMKDHQLKGKWKGVRECHLAPNVLLFYTQEGNVITLRTIGTHDDLR